MKKILFCSLLWLSCSCLASDVVLIGHRGSSEGVENTLVAYQAGADRGYYGLETDIRVTKDGAFVCSHDANLKEWNYPKVVVEKTKLKDLRKLFLVQKRWGNVMEGTITTLEEYLDLCESMHVVPVIELKWTTGINSNNLSNMPKFLQIIKDKNMLHKAVFISFMKEPLVYIREHEGDDIQIQFLCMPQSERSNFEWIKKYHFDLDICQGFDPAIVEKYHREGLKVNCWTIDNAEVANAAIAAGVDMITTNKLVAADLRQPERLPKRMEGVSRLDTTYCVLENGDTTGVCVYTPAGYDQNDLHYPVLYLLHGSGDDETGWADKGHMVSIMDSMIASGLCRPMVVVMPNGYMETYRISQHIEEYPEYQAHRNFTDGQFVLTFPQIKQWAENTYRIRPEKKYNAIAGLSMGGFHTFHIAHHMPLAFDYVAPFSGLFVPRNKNIERSLKIASISQYPSDAYRNIEAELEMQFRHAPQLYWIACGEKDRLLPDNQALCDYLSAHQYDYRFHESTGGHSWRNWMDYLTQLVPMLF